jgi:hypothetical protein
MTTRAVKASVRTQIVVEALLERAFSIFTEDKWRSEQQRTGDRRAS